MDVPRCLRLAAGALLFIVAPAVADQADSPAANAAKYDLKYKFHPGETLRMEAVHRAAVDTTVAGTTQTAQTLSKSIKAWRIIDVADTGSVTFEHAVESVDMRHKMSGRAEVTYDSKVDSQAPAGYEDVAKAIGVTLSVVTVDPRGKIIKREDKQTRPNSQYGGNQMLVPLPAEPVGIGFSWTVPHDVDVVVDNASRRMKCRQRYELMSVKEGIATIELETQLLTPVDDPKIKAQLAQRLSKGSIRFDIAAGRLVSQQMDWDERVIGFSGADSSMRYLAQFTEQLLPSAAKTAAKTSPAAKQATPRRPVSKATSPPTDTD